MVKHLWFLCSGQISSWSSWVSSYLLRGRNLQEISCPGDCSWSWRKLLGMRTWVSSRMKFRIGNGERASLWFDNWHPFGPIAEVKGDRIIYDSGLDRMAKVASIIDGSTWRWPFSQSHDLLDIIHAMPSDYCPDSSKEDELVYEEDLKGAFSVRRVWETLRNIGSSVGWSRIVWFSKAIPRHAFLLWMTIQGGLYTQDRMLASGMIHQSRCVLCDGDREDVDHLFFRCSYSSCVWSSILGKCDVDWSPRDWLESLAWMKQFTSASLSHLIIRLSFAATVYFIWKERNASLHDRASRTHIVICRDIIFAVRTRVSLLRKVIPSYDNEWLHHSWQLSDDIFL